MSQTVELKSIYKVLGLYIKQAQKLGDYIKGYIDGEDNLKEFIKEYSLSSNTKFIVRTSCKKSKDHCNGKQKIGTNGTRYGQTDRIYWEFNNRNLFVPFTGTPFVIHSSQVKQCQHGAQYYKLKAEKCKSKQQNDSDSQTTNTLDACKKSFFTKGPSSKPTKKRNCPAHMYIREILSFSDYSLPPESYDSPNHILRKEKAQIIAKLKQDMQAKNLSVVHRFFLHVPLPEAHADHPVDTATCPLRVMNPFIKAKIDELVVAGYQSRHIELIVEDYINEALVHNNLPPNVLPSLEEVRDYVYLSTITSPTIVEVQTKETVDDGGAKVTPTSIHSELKKKIEELKELLHNCKDEETLKSVKLQTKAIAKKLKGGSLLQNHRNNNKRSAPVSYQVSQKRPKMTSNFDKTSHPVSEPYNLHDHITSNQNTCYTTNGRHFSTCLPDSLPLLSANDPIAISNQHPPVPCSDSNILTSFNRLLESDQDVFPSLVDHVVADQNQFGHVTLPGTPDFISMSQLHTQ